MRTLFEIDKIKWKVGYGTFIRRVITLFQFKTKPMCFIKSENSEPEETTLPYLKGVCVLRVFFLDRLETGYFLLLNIFV